MKHNVKRLSSLVIALLYTFLQPTAIFADEIISPPEVSAESVVLIDAKTGFVIYEKNMNEQCFPASTTKIMTALLTLEYAKENYDERILFSENAVFGIERGSSHIAIDVGETLTINEALYAIMLASANEVSAALAEHIGGSIEGFADMMNARAKELGANNTNFANPHGLPNDNHYTTAHDLALIMKECIKSDKFNEVIATKRYDIPPREKQPEICPLNNTNQLILNGKYHYDNIVGGKTGYTDIARHSLVSYAKKRGVGLIAVILKAEKNVPYTDSIALYDYGFKMYDEIKLLDKNNYSTSLTVYGDEDKTTATLIPRKDVYESLPKGFDIDKVELIPVTDDIPEDEINKGLKCGVLNINYESNTIAQVDLIASKIVREPLPESSLESGNADKEVFNQLDEEGNGYPNQGFDIVMLSSVGLIIVIFLASLVFIVLKLSGRQRSSRRRLRYSSYRSNNNYRFK